MSTTHAAARSATVCGVRPLAALLLGTLVLAGPADAAPARERAAARVFVARTARFDVRQRALAPRALAAASAARRAARQCSSEWMAAPPQLKGDLGTLWFENISGALWNVDRRPFGAWIRGLGRDPVIARSPVLAGAARALRRSYAVAETVYTAVPDACATVRAWHASAWAMTARPAALTTIAHALAGDRAIPERAVRALRRLGRPRAEAGRAAELLGVGTDEPDARVETGSCDAVGGYLLDGYAGCGPH